MFGGFLVGSNIIALFRLVGKRELDCCLALTQTKKGGFVEVSINGANTTLHFNDSRIFESVCDFKEDSGEISRTSDRNRRLRCDDRQSRIV
jgi:hypothetical protein